VIRFARGFARFWWDFVIGDDWRIAAGVAAVLGIGAVLVTSTDLPNAAICVLVGAGILIVVVATVIGGGIAATRKR
jgi:hypothetical protein